jgi:hypothetical protein
MLRPLALCLALVALIHQAQAQTSQTPPILIAGLNAYIAFGHDSALAIWERGSPARGQASVQVRRGLEDLEASYGRATGFDILANVAIGSRVVRTYYVVLFENGPLYGLFDSFRTATTQIMTGFLLNSKPQEILPAAMLAPPTHPAP